MSTLLRAIARIHRFCINHLVYPLVLSSLFACALFAGRVYLSRTWIFSFLIWNLFLAWIPYFISLGIALMHQRNPRGGWLLIVPTALWLLFLPNAPYIITDLWHLEGYRPMPMWYDIGMIAGFAWSGLFLAVTSLNAMQTVARDYFGRVASWLFAFAAIGLSGFGIYLGRFLDWNSWDLFFHPENILLDIITRVAHPIRYSQTYGVTILFSAFFFICYVTFVSIDHRRSVGVSSDST
jgi:uncharacterized membrane protein